MEFWALQWRSCCLSDQSNRFEQHKILMKVLGNLSPVAAEKVSTDRWRKRALMAHATSPPSASHTQLTQISFHKDNILIEYFLIPSSKKWVSCNLCSFLVFLQCSIPSILPCRFLASLYSLAIRVKKRIRNRAKIRICSQSQWKQWESKELALTKHFIFPRRAEWS